MGNKGNPAKAGFFVEDRSDEPIFFGGENNVICENTKKRFVPKTILGW